jgi:hypothetical protein
LGAKRQKYHNKRKKGSDSNYIRTLYVLCLIEFFFLCNLQVHVKACLLDVNPTMGQFTAGVPFTFWGMSEFLINYYLFNQHLIIHASSDHIHAGTQTLNRYGA